MCVVGGGGRSKTARRESSRRVVRKIKDVREGSPACAYRSRGAINRRKQSLIFRNFNSQSVELAATAPDEQNVREKGIAKSGTQAAREQRDNLVEQYDAI